MCAIFCNFLFLNIIYKFVLVPLFEKFTSELWFKLHDHTLYFHYLAFKEFISNEWIVPALTTTPKMISSATQPASESSTFSTWSGMRPTGSASSRSVAALVVSSQNIELFFAELRLLPLECLTPRHSAIQVLLARAAHFICLSPFMFFEFKLCFTSFFIISYFRIGIIISIKYDFPLFLFSWLISSIWLQK